MKPCGDESEQDLWLILPEFLDEMNVVRQVTENTLDAYRRDMEQVLSTLADGKPAVPVSAWCEESLKLIVVRLALAWSPRSIERMLSTWRQFNLFCMRRGIMNENAAKRVASPAFLMNTPVPIEKSKVLAALDGMIERDERTLRDRALMELVCGCGLQVSELADLRVADLDVDAECLRVESGRSNRTVSLPDRASLAVQRYLTVTGRDRSDVGLLFCGNTRSHISERTIQRALLLRLSEFAGGERVTARNLRAAFVMWLIQDGHDLDVVSRVAGHKRLTTTQRYAEFSSRARACRPDSAERS